jgi:hypothetical protein
MSIFEQSFAGAAWQLPFNVDLNEGDTAVE